MCILTYFNFSRLGYAFFCLLILSSSLSAQELNPTEQAIAGRRLLNDNNINAVVRSYDNRYEGLKGSPMAFETYMSGVVETNGGKQHEYESINYEAYGDEIVVLNSKGNPEYLPKGMIKSFYLIPLDTELDTLKFR